MRWWFYFRDENRNNNDNNIVCRRDLYHRTLSRIGVRVIIPCGWMSSFLFALDLSSVTQQQRGYVFMWNMTRGVRDVEFHGGYCDDRSNPSLEIRGCCYNEFRILRWDISCIVLSHYFDHVCRKWEWWYLGFSNGGGLWHCVDTTVPLRGRGDDAIEEICCWIILIMLNKKS